MAGPRSSLRQIWKLENRIRWKRISPPEEHPEQVSALLLSFLAEL